MSEYSVDITKPIERVEVEDFKRILNQSFEIWGSLRKEFLKLDQSMRGGVVNFNAADGEVMRPGGIMKIYHGEYSPIARHFGNYLYVIDDAINGFKNLLEEVGSDDEYVNQDVIESATLLCKKICQNIGMPTYEHFKFLPKNIYWSPKTIFMIMRVHSSLVFY